MFALIGFIIKMTLLALGALFIYAGSQKWRWFSKLVFGKKNRDAMGENTSNMVLIAIGIVAAILALIWIF